MRLLPLLWTVLWAALLGSPLRGGSSLRHPIYWNSSNPRLLRGDAVVELGLNDYLDIYCPHYEGPGPPEGPETFALYMVDWLGYQACRAQGAGAFKRWVCSLPFAPSGPVRFSEKIQRFTPFSLGFEFLPGETYYYISVPTPGSSGQCLRLQVSVCCKEAPTRKSGFGGVELLSQLRAKAEDLAAGHCLPWDQAAVHRAVPVSCLPPPPLPPSGKGQRLALLGGGTDLSSVKTDLP
ncbi:ephrin-A3 isoform X2 [Ochotona princeps]|uniref:ephrin-A3 isoform X2 n=1 Tax=Ochotona princeps TaxID=9978 RepID=UPI002714E4EE|nr:ephrin-A3 isoform X2 [Ochotona princeps]